MSSSDSLGNYCYIKTQPTVDSYFTFLGVLLHKPSAYSQEFGLLFQFGCLSTNDMLNCKSNEFLGTRVIVPKSE
jgi:hypothetical protein